MSKLDIEVLRDKPVGYWKLDETSGTTAVDASGNGHDGNYSDNYDLEGKPLVSGAESSVYFSGGKVVVPSFDVINLSGISIEGWYDLKSYDSRRQISGSLEKSIRLIDVSSNGKFYWHFGDGSAWFYVAQQSWNLPLGLHHIAHRYNYEDRIAEIYIDGDLVDSIDSDLITSNSLSISGKSYIIGDYTSSSSLYFRGNNSHFTIYDYTLTPDQIQSHYEAGSEFTDYSDIILHDEPISYFMMDETPSEMSVYRDEPDVHSMEDGTLINTLVNASGGLEINLSNLDWGYGGATDDTTLGADSPFLIDLEDYDVSNGMVLDGDGDRANSPDNPSFHIKTDLDVRGDVRPDVWASGVHQTIVGNRGESPAATAFQFRVTTSGRLDLVIGGGSSYTVHTSDVVPAADGERIWVRGTLDADDGAGNHVVMFYTSIDGGATWTQLGGPSTIAGTITIPDPSYGIDVGGRWQNTEMFTGTIYEAQVRNGIDGPLVANPKFEGAHISGGVTSFLDGQGNTWTLNGNASIASGTASQVMWLPGASGNYASIPDTNLLDADTAHLHQSKGLWGLWARADTFHLDTIDALFGKGVLEVVATTDGSSAAVDTGNGSTTGFDIVEGQEYTASFYVRADADNSVVEDGVAAIRWGDGTNNLSRSNGTTTSITDQWQQVSVTATAPTGATIASVAFEVGVGGATHVIGDTWYIDQVCLRTGSDPTFIPSHRVVKDIDIRARLAPKDWSTHQYAVAKYSGGNAYILNTGSGADGLRLWWTDSGGVANSIISPTVPHNDRECVWIRATLDVDNGAGNSVIRFYTSLDGSNWTQLGTDVTGAVTDIINVGNNLAFGSNSPGSSAVLLGTLPYAELRDGINGPSVASFDFTDQAGVNPTTDTSQTTEGHTVSVNRSGDATTEIIDRNAWSFTGVEDLQIPNRSEVDITDGQLEIVGRYLTRSTEGTLLSKKLTGGSSHIGWWTKTSNGGNPRPYMELVDEQGNLLGVTGSFTYLYGVWNKTFYIWDGVSQVTIEDDSGNEVSKNTSLSSLSNSEEVRVGALGSGGSRLEGQISWVILFRSNLTDSERSELIDWNSEVSTEPSWLREKAEFYINANDPLAKTDYKTRNQVTNLADTPRRDLPVLDLSVMQNVAGSKIRWLETKPANTNIVIETSPDGDVWTPASNGGEVPNVSAIWGAGGDN